MCTQTDSQLHHYRLDASGWTHLTSFGAGVDSAPCLIEGTYGAHDEIGVGNFELCVAVGGTIEHWWRYNAGLGPWTRSAVFGTGVRRVIGLIQSTFATDLEVIVENQMAAISTGGAMAAAGIPVQPSDEVTPSRAKGASGNPCTGRARPRMAARFT